MRMTTASLWTPISYNTDAFLKNWLTGLIENGTILGAAFIRHQPDNDSTKEHCHCIVSPARTIDTLKLIQQTTELMPDGSIASIPKLSANSKTSQKQYANWVLYALHDERYLASKQLTRNVHYDFSQFWTSDDEFRQYLHNAVVDYVEPKAQYVIECMEQGYVPSAAEMLSRGLSLADSVNVNRLLTYGVRNRELND